MSEYPYVNLEHLDFRVWAGVDARSSGLELDARSSSLELDAQSSSLDMKSQPLDAVLCLLFSMHCIE